MNRLDGKSVLITGASRGLGRQLALDFAQEGVARLVLTARGSAELEETRRLPGSAVRFDSATDAGAD